MTLVPINSFNLCCKTEKWCPLQIFKYCWTAAVSTRWVSGWSLIYKDFWYFLFFWPCVTHGVDLLVQKWSSRQWQIGDEERRETGGTPLLEKAEQDCLLELCRCEWDFLPDTVGIWGETEIPVIKRHRTVYVANVLLPVALANCLFCSGRNVEIFSVTVRGEKKGISRLKREVVFKRDLYWFKKIK